MQTIDKINPELISMLDNWTDWFDNQNYGSLVTDERRHGEHDIDYYCGDDYLHSVMYNDSNHKGPPEYAKVTDFHNTHGIPDELRTKSLELSTELGDWLGTKYTAVHVLYPVGGFMSWHNNWDCPGYNILLTRCDGQGFFRYLEHGKVKTIDDDIGWQAKVGYYGGPDNPYWHCAGSRGVRETIGFVTPNQAMWEMMVEDICSQ